jgi:hypothetical protein
MASQDERRGEPGHYEELGVTPTASPAELRAAYLALARAHHPDTMGDAGERDRQVAAARMARVNAAWTVLSDPARRAAYDARLDLGAAPPTNVRDPGQHFTPFDDGDDIDPRLLDDTPSGAPTLPRAAAFVPVVLGAIGVGMVLFGALLAFGGLLIAGFFVLALSGLSFLGLPFLALINASRSERR